MRFISYVSTPEKGFRMPRTPFPHQLIARDFGVRNRGACYWMEMRTGKTFSTLLAVKELEAWPLLIVCPKSVMGVWEAEFRLEGAEENTVGVLDGHRGMRMKLLKEERPVYICNFEMLADYDMFRIRKWAAIVIDESIKIGNITSKRTQYVLDYIQSKSYPEGQVRFCLSGSPASESPFQLIPQMYFVHGNFMGTANWEDYIRLNWQYNSYNFKWEPIRKKAHVEEIRKWNKANSYQLTMKELGLTVPMLKRRIEFPLTATQINMLDKVRGDAFYGDSKQYTPLVRANHELQICCGIDPESKIVFDTRKIEHILDWHLDEGNEPLLVCSEFRTGVMDKFKEIADKKKIKVGFMVGGQPEENKKVKALFDAGKLNVIFGQVEVVKMGLNFSRASTIFYLSNSYSQDDRTQSEVRCNQMGKTEPTEIIDLIHPLCLDGAVVDLLEKKQDVSSSFVQKFYERR